MMWRSDVDTWWWGLPVKVQAGMLVASMLPWCWLWMELWGRL